MRYEQVCVEKQMGDEHITDYMELALSIDEVFNRKIQNLVNI